MRIESMAATSADTQAASSGEIANTQDFMTLLVAQLQAQNPLEPMESSEFLSQLSQLQTVSELRTISSALSQQSLGSALSLIGHTVSFEDSAGTLQSAVVERVELNDGEWTVIADGRELSLGELIAVE